MIKRFYPALIRKDKGSDYSISLPDIDGYFSFGKSVEECIELAKDGINFHISGLIEDGVSIPMPTPLEKLKINKSDKDIVMVYLIEATIPGRSKRINIIIDENLLERIDSVTRNRSAFIAEAVGKAL